MQAQLIVQVVSGKDLPGKDLNGKSDPYCLVTVNGRNQQRTRTIPANRNPEWRDGFSFQLQQPDRDVVKVEVYDADQMSDDYLGEVLFYPRTLLNTPGNRTAQWFPLIHRHGHRVTGGVFLDCNLVLPQGFAPPAGYNNPPPQQQQAPMFNAPVPQYNPNQAPQQPYQQPYQQPPPPQAQAYFQQPPPQQQAPGWGAPPPQQQQQQYQQAPGWGAPPPQQQQQPPYQQAPGWGAPPPQQYQQPYPPQQQQPPQGGWQQPPPPQYQQPPYQQPQQPQWGQPGYQGPPPQQPPYRG